MTPPLSLTHPADRSWQGNLRSLLRFVVGFMYACHGAAKIFGVLGGMPPNGNAVVLTSLLGAAGIIEFFGGCFIMLGLFTQPVAFICSGEMAVAYFHVHAKQGFLPYVNKGELAVVYCFLFLYFAFAGGGPISLDAMFRRRSKA